LGAFPIFPLENSIDFLFTQGINNGQFRDFHGNSIPVDGDTVAKVVRERLRGSL